MQNTDFFKRRCPVSPIISVLYIDDQEDLLDIGKRFLERKGTIRVDICPSPHIAMQILKTKQYDAIISDYEMPEMDGISLLKRVREEDPSVPFIIFTGKGREEVVIEALNSGADFYLQKGGDPRAQFAELIHKVHHAVKRRNAEIDVSRHIELIKKITQFSTQFIAAEPDQIRSIINDTFTEKSYLFRADEGFVLIEKPETHDILFYHKWNRDGKPSPREPGLDYQILIFQSFYQHLSKLYPVMVSLQETEDFSDDCLNSMRNEGVQSFILLPLVLKNTLVGVLGLATFFCQNRWNEEELDILRIFGQAIINAVFRNQYETALLESEQKYRNVVELQTELICRFQPDGTHIFVNDAYCRYFRKSPEEIIGTKFIPNIPAEDKIRLKTYLKSFSRLNRTGTIEHRIILDDGTVHWHQWNEYAIYDDSGSILEFQSVGREITDQKRTELALADSEKLYRTLFESTGTAMTILDEDGLILTINSEFERLSGIPKDEVEHHRFFDSFVGDYDIERMNRYHTMRRITGVSAPSQYEFSFKRKNNDVIDVFVTVTLLHDSKKSVASIIDISQIKKNQMMFNESETKFRILAESLSVGVYIIQEERFVYVNPFVEALFGFPACYIYTHSMYDFIFPEDRERFGKAIENRIRGSEKRAQYRVRVQSKNGIIRFIEIRGAVTEIKNEVAIVGIMTESGDINA